MGIVVLVVPCNDGGRAGESAGWGFRWGVRSSGRVNSSLCSSGIL